jgi:DNA-binding response OmpR family regulator
VKVGTHELGVALLIVSEDWEEVSRLREPLVAAAYEIVATTSRDVAAGLLQRGLFSAGIIDHRSWDSRFRGSRGEVASLLVLDPVDLHSDRDFAVPDVDDFIERPWSSGELVRRVSLLVGNRRTDEDGSSDDVALRVQAGEVHLGDRTIQLRPREFDVLCLLLARRGEVVSTDLILREAWGPDFGSRNLVEAQISRLRAKLRGTEAEGAIRTIRGVGYLIH